MATEKLRPLLEDVTVNPVEASGRERRAMVSAKECRSQRVKVDGGDRAKLPQPRAGQAVSGAGRDQKQVEAPGLRGWNPA